MAAVHAKFSPSAMYRRAPCPGSWAAELNKPNVQSEAATEGTFAHSFGEHCIDTGDDPLGFVGDTHIFGEHTLEITEDMAKAVKVYVDYAREVSDGADEFRTEIRLQMPGHADFFGTADLLVANDFGPLVIADYKHGVGHNIQAEGNLQLAAYMLGALRYARDKGITALSLKGVIIQPRVYDWNGPRVWEVVDIDAFEKKWTAYFEGVIVACLSKNPKRCAGDHCTFCLAKLECPELKDKLLLAAIEEFKDAEPEKITTDQVKEIVTDASLDELVRIHSHASIINDFLKTTLAHLKARAEAGETIPGFKLVRSVGNRTWDLPEAEMVKKFRNKKLKQSDFYNQKLKSPAQIEKILDDEKFFEKFVIRPDKGLALVSESDKRPAVEIKSAVQEFEDLTQGERFARRANT